jgi:putative IMPACT (imprinted ancient) family translation regulator
MSQHMCLGYVAFFAGMTERCYDDGKPTGTSGVLILSAIRGQGLLDTLCVVVRYFGGIKLGAGGLIRAYGGTAPAPQAQLDEI